MIATCCDTSFLVSLYGSDPNTARARTLASALKNPVIISDLNQFELEQALNYLIWRKVIQFAEGYLIKAALATDCESGAVLVRPCHFGRTLTRASRLSAKHTSGAGYRSMDILLVAAALELGAQHFISFDVNQRKLAKAEGLKLNP